MEESVEKVSSGKKKVFDIEEFGSCQGQDLRKDLRGYCRNGGKTF